METWKGEDIVTDEGIKHLYGIGAYSWVWDKSTVQECRYLAELVEDFIYEYDTYGYRDVGIERNEMVEAIKEQLKDLTTFKQVYEIWYNEDLTEEATFEALGGILQ